jgi:AbrB family looped-hinge helix DNA binding protein
MYSLSNTYYLTYFSYRRIIVVDMHDKQLYGTATVGTKGQVVIPADARDALNIQPGDRLYVVGSQEKKWIGFIKEEQLRDMLDHLTNNIEQYKDILKK